MTGRLVNIPRDIVDDYYRYKMPVLRAKVEGKGNGIKTVVENMEDIAKALQRPTAYPIKFFGFELGALTKVDTEINKHVVNGKHEAETLARVLDEFIKRYVLCKTCRNPETVLEVRGEIIVAKCKACGKTNAVDMSHKLSTYILRNPPERSAEPSIADSKKKGSKQKKGDTTTSTSTATTAARRPNDPSAEAEAAADLVWSVDTSAKAVEERRRELLGTRDRLTQREEEDGDGGDEDGEGGAGGEVEKKASSLAFVQGENPIPVLKKYFLNEEGLPSSDLDFVKCVVEVQEATAKMGWSEIQTMRAIFAALFDPDIKVNFYKKCDILALFVKNVKHEKIIISCIEKVVTAKGGALIKELSNILNGFYEEAIVSEDVIQKWYEHVSKGAESKGTDAKAVQDRKNAALLKTHSTPFVEWLQNADSESEDDHF